MIAVVVSESSIVLSAIARVIESSFSKILRCTKLEEISFASDELPSLIILDLSRPADDAQTILRIVPQFARDRLVVLTKLTHDLRDLMPLVGKVGAIVPHTSELEEIALIGRVVRAGLCLLPSQMVDHLRTPIARNLQELALATSLTEREASVLGLIAKGCSNKLIARHLGINDATVRVHVRSVLRKVGVHNRTEAALLITSDRGAEPSGLPALPALLQPAVALHQIAN